MRLDLLLKYLCLVKSRNVARKGCEEGFIKLNGRRVPAHKEVKVEDVVEISYPDRTVVVSITEIPLKQVSRKERHRYYRVLREHVRENPLD